MPDFFLHSGIQSSSFSLLKEGLYSVEFSAVFILRCCSGKIKKKIVLGDAGYPLSPIVLLPIVDAPEGSPEYRYTTRHTHTRCTIERVFGILKGRFRCLHKDRVLSYQPEVAADFFKACAVLHNILIHFR